MHCEYCFYKDEAQKREQESYGIMPKSTAEKIIDSALEDAGANGTVNFAFQGGEPTLAGINFFKNFIDYVNLRNQRSADITYSIQTNGFNIDNQWAELWVKNNFLVGVSFDGNQELHDTFRTDAAGNGTWEKIRSSIALLISKHVEINLLCVVTKQCAKNAAGVYRAMKQTGVGHFQFIPCLDPLDHQRRELSYSLTAEDYGNFLCSLFDLWYKDWKSGNYKSIRLFDDYVYMVMGAPAGTCSTAGTCGGYFVIEADGSVYPCDFYALDEWRLGKIEDCSLKEMAISPKAMQFFKNNRPQECSQCKWVRLCNGGCKRDWVENHDRRENKSNYYCAAFKKFFNYAMPRIIEIARAEMQYRK